MSAVPKPKDECGNCLFSVLATFATPSGAAVEQLLCRRHPPQPLIMLQQVKPSPANPAGVQQSVVAHFAPVSPETICGEWRTRDRNDHRTWENSGIMGVMSATAPMAGPVIGKLTT